MKKLSAVILSVTVLSSALDAQRDLKAGFGAQSLVIDLDAGIGGLGLVYLKGEVFVPTRSSPAVGGLHFVSVFDNSGSGVAVRSWFQAGFAQASEWGFRDGTTDGCNLFFGFDFGIEIVDVDGVLQTGLGTPNFKTGNGPRTVLGGLISGNVVGLGQLGSIGAISYDRNGNDGEGSFWAANSGSSMFEIDLAGDVLHAFPNAGENSSHFSLIDPASGGSRLWINSGPEPEKVVEYDLTTGTLTGVSMRVSVPGSPGFRGLDIAPGTFARGPGASGWDVLLLQRGQPDQIHSRRLHLDGAGLGIPPSPVTRLGTLEPDLLGSIDDEDIFARSDRATLNYTLDSFELDLFFDIARDPGDGLGTGGHNGVPAVIFANIGPDAAPGVDATSNLLGIRELAHLQPLLTTPSATRVPRSMGMVLTNDPMSSSPSEWRIPLTPGMAFQATGDCLRFQGLWIDDDVAFLPIALTNQLRLCRGPDPACGLPGGTFAQFMGGNTFNADTTSGYNSLTNEQVDRDFSIVRLKYSIRPGDPANSALTQQLFDTFFRWDTDNGGMADLFEGGGSRKAGCVGTYRNGSEVSTGLILSGTPQQNATPCDPSALQGWVGSDDGETAFGAFDGDWLTLEFTFSPDTFMNGAVFEFDADTDGGVGVNGNSMAGVIVEVEFKNGMIRRGEAMADPNNPGRGFVQL